MDSKGNLNKINKESWDAYQEDYMKFKLMARPDFYEFFSNGGVDLDSFVIELAGDVKGLKLLDTCCAADAVQAFSFHNLGAKVTACDITPKAIEIASQNAKRMKLDVEFVVADSQTLEPVADNQFDIVFATYLVWLQDINEAFKTWKRVLKPGGKLLVVQEHPFTACLNENKGGFSIGRNYNIKTRELFKKFTGTPLADRFGGWSAELPSIENFYRISDIFNAIINAGFYIEQVYESANENDTPLMANLPCEIAIVAVKK